MIAPSILNADFYNLGQEVEKIKEADWIHVDVMDGHFVPNLSFGSLVVEALRPHTDQFLDCHLMVANPDAYIDSFKKAGADGLTVHLEASPHIHRTLQTIRAAGMQVGLAINPGTTVEAVRPLIRDVDLILVMTVNPGFGGQSFLDTMVPKIEQLKEWRTALDLDYKIQVDGGINGDTGKLCVEAGADVLVAGSYIYQSDAPKEALRTLQSLF